MNTNWFEHIVYLNWNVFGQELARLLDEEIIMENQDRQPIETLESQMLKRFEEREEKDCATPPYRPPQVFLVGKAKRLMAGFVSGRSSDSSGLYNWP